MIIWIVHIAIILLVSVCFFKTNNGGFSYTIFSLGLVIKLIAGLMVGWIFIYYYQSGDTISFFEEAKKMASLPMKEYVPQLFSSSSYATSAQPRVLFFTKFLSVFALMTNGSYWISSMYLSLLSFFASWYFVITLSKIYSSYNPLFLICFLFIPSIVFWSSGILKDTMAYTALVCTLCVVIKKYFHQKLRPLEWVIALVSLFCLLKVKHYLFIAIILFIGVLLFLKLMISSKAKTKVLAIPFFILVLLSTQLVHPYLRLDRIVETIYLNNQKIIEATKPENRLDINVPSPEVADLFKAMPAAIQVGLFRPALFDPTPIWGWFHRIENTLLAFLSILSVILYFWLKPKIDIPLVMAASAVILLLAVMLALTTPNFGTLVRYKNAFLPFFFLLGSILPYRYFFSK